MLALKILYTAFMVQRQSNDTELQKKTFIQSNILIVPARNCVLIPLSYKFIKELYHYSGIYIIWNICFYQSTGYYQLSSFLKTRTILC